MRPPVTVLTDQPYTMYAIKTEVTDPGANSWTFSARKAMYGGKKIRVGDELFAFARENAVAPVWSPAASSFRQKLRRKWCVSNAKLLESTSSSVARVRPGADSGEAISTVSLIGMMDVPRPN